MVAITSEQYVILDGILFHIFELSRQGISITLNVVKQLAVPKSLCKEVLEAYHDSLLGAGHGAFERTYIMVRQKYCLPRMHSDVQACTTSCEKCQFSKRKCHARPAPLTPLPITDTFQMAYGYFRSFG